MYPSRDTNKMGFTPALLTFLFALIVLSQAAIGEIIFTEINYHSGKAVKDDEGVSGPDPLEFLELFNNSSETIELSGFYFSNGIQFTFPAGSRINPQTFVVIAKNPEGFENEYQIRPDFGPFTGSLSNSGERLTLRDFSDREIWDGSFSDKGDWPAEADGAGYSIVYEKWNDSHLRGRNWQPSRNIGGSPGTWDTPQEANEKLILKKGDPVRYFKGRQEPSNGNTNWTRRDFELSNAWLNGRSGLGYSSAANERAFITTTLNDMRGSYLSVYARFPFQISNTELNNIEKLQLDLAYDDGYVVYLNGSRIASANISGNPPPYNRNASTGSDYPPIAIDLTRHLENLVAGENILAIQGHNVGISSSSDFVMSPTLSLKLKESNNLKQPWQYVIINEILANTESGDDYVEFYNTGSESIDLGGYHISDSTEGEPKFTIPTGTIISGFEHLVFDRSVTGIGLSSKGEKVLLYRPDAKTVVDAYAWDEHQPEVSIGRFPDGSQNWFYSSELSPGKPNKRNRVYPVILNELMYHDPEGERFEFVEILNIDNEFPVDISNWHFVGLTYQFPEQTIINPSQHLVICDARAEFVKKYNISFGDLFGDYSGGLRDKGETILLQDSFDVVIDYVEYDDKAPWPLTPDGLGASLERSCIDHEWNNAQHWSASPIQSPSPGQPNSIIGCTPSIPGPLQFTEVLYHSSTLIEDERNQEYVEIFNPSQQDINLSGWVLAGDVFYAFPDGSQIKQGERILITYSPERIMSIHDLAEDLVFGPYTNGIPNGGGNLVLINPQGQLSDRVEFNDDFPWPSQADGIGSNRGPGKSLTRIEGTVNGQSASSWFADSPTPAEVNADPEISDKLVIQNLFLEPSPELITSSVEPTLKIVMEQGIHPTKVEVRYFREDINRSNETKLILDAELKDSGIWETEFPQFPPNSIIHYEVIVSLENDDSLTSPDSSRDQFRWHSYFVDPEVSSSQPNQYHIFISSLNWRKLHTWTDAGRVSGGQPNPTWNNQAPAWFVGDGNVYPVMVRHQGSRWNRRNGSTINFECDSHLNGQAQVRSWRVEFPAYRRFRGLDTVLLQKQSGWPQRISFAMFEMAGVPAPRTSWADLRINGCEYNPDAFQIERPGRDMVDRWFDEVGDLYKSQGFTGNEGPWSWGDARLIRGSRNGFTESQRYKYTYSRKTLKYKSNLNDNTPDFPEALIEGLHEARDRGRVALRQYLEDNFDVDLTLRYICTINYVGTFDDMFQNHYLYRQAGSGKWCMFPWDMDNTLGGAFGQSNAHPFRGVDESRFGSVGNRSGWWNRIKDSFFIAYPEEFLQMFYYLNNNVYDPDKVRTVIEQIAREGNRSSSVNGLMNHINARHQYLNNFIENELQSGPITLSIQRTDTRLEIQWTANGSSSILESASSPNGPWVPESEGIEFDGQHFKFVTRPDNAERFYRTVSE